ncbi:TetR family transcriptional regulator [Paractinoplanes deccanensis]|uniref:TetR family transcriptional regulator n=1 Tax=Paractinoplanes deccanensis TaxID=113561 RepID=A0ABQ3YLU0_9ACTN|nr:TetR/AcrR family transcriptional regulator [Actinoplanes deccanensis]GID80963.1 TetR family transcriptional regulator [Actinoplanes deccanensis]
MPKIVDHDQRRSDIVEAFLSVVARKGLPAATSRAIAAELGVGTGALWHYFDGFDAVTAAAYQRVFERTNERIAGASTGRRGLAALDAMMREILPLEKETLDEAQVVVGFWGRLAANDKLSAGEADVSELWGGRLRTHLHEAVEDGDLVRGTPVDGIVDLLLSLAIGQQVHAVMGTPLTAPARQLALIEHCLAPWRPAARRE